MTTKPNLGGYRSVNDQVTTQNWNDALDFQRWVQEMLAGTNGTEKVSAAALSQVPQAEKNILANPGFEVWQRGAGGTHNGSTGIVQAGPDGWQVLGGITQRDTGTVDGSATSIQFIANGNGASVAQLNLEAEKYRSKQLSFSIRVIGGLGYAYIQDEFNIYNGQALDSTGVFTTYTVTGIISTGALSIVAGFVAQQNATYFLDNAMLTQSPGPVAYVPLDPAEDWLRIRRRYARYPFHCRFRTSSVNEHHEFSISFPRMVNVPSFGVIDLSTATQNNVGSVAVVNSSDTFATIDVVGSAANTDTYIVGGVLPIDSLIN